MSRLAIAVVALLALVGVVGSGALTSSAFTSRSDNTGNTFATVAQFEPRLAAGSKPAVTGTTAEGSTLTGTIGTWKGSPTYAWAWQRCNADATSCVDVATGTGATVTARTLPFEDAGKRMRLRVTATNAVRTVTAYSDQTSVVTSPKVHNITPPRITDGERAGQTFTADPGTWGGTPAPALTYKWQRCVADGSSCIEVPGATGLTVATTLDDEGALLRIVVKATNTVSGTTYNQTKPAELIVKPPPLTAVAGIVGSAEVGMRLTSSPGFNGPVDESTVTYQWQRCTDASSCVDIDGATDPNYTTTQHDVGRFLRYHLFAKSADGQSQVDRDGVLTDQAVKARRMASIGDAPTALKTASDGRLFVGGTRNMKFAKAYTGPLAAVSADGTGELSQVSKTPLVKTADNTSTAVIGDGQGGYILGVTAYKLPDGSTRSLIRVRGDGSIDLSYPDTNTGGRVVSLARGRDNTIYATGLFTSLQKGGTSYTRNSVAAIGADGNVKPNFIANADGTAMVYGVATAPGGRVYLAGDFSSINGAPRNRIALLTTDGTLQPFNPPLSVWGGAQPGHCVGGRSIKVASDGIVYMTGFNCQDLNGAPVRGNAVAFKPDGTPLPGYSIPNLNDNPHDLWVTDDHLYVGGFFTAANGQTRNRIARFDRRTGAMDALWKPSFNGTVWDIIQQGNTVYTVGEFTSVDGTPRTYAAAVRADSAALLPWAPKIDGPPNDMILEGGGIQMTGGKMAWWDAQTRYGLAVLDRDGQLLPSTLAIDTGAVKAIEIDGPSAWIGGTFTKVDTTSRNGLARITSADYQLDVSTTYPEVTGDVRTLAYQGGSLWVGGGWTGGTSPRVARYTDGVTVNPRRPNVNQVVNSIIPVPSGGVALGAGSVAGVSTAWTNPTPQCSTGTLYSLVAVWSEGPTTSPAVCTGFGGLETAKNAGVWNSSNAANQINGAVVALAAEPTIRTNPDSTKSSFIQGAGWFANQQVGPSAMVNAAHWDWQHTDQTGQWYRQDLNAASHAVAWSPGTSSGAFIMGGEFTAQAGGTKPYLVAFAPKGTAPVAAFSPPALGSGSGKWVNSLAVDGGVVYVGGTFSTLSPTANKPEPSGNLVALKVTDGSWMRYGQ